MPGVGTRYFDPGRCPGCGESLPAGAASCAECGLVVQGPTAMRLGQVLQEADALVAQLRQPVPSPATGAAPAPTEPAGPVAGHPAPDTAVPTPPSLPRLALPEPRAPALSVPTVLLGLGALCVLVAATVFVAVTWGDLSVGARTLMLLAVTAAFAVGAVVVTRRGLSGSAESLWLIVAGMLAVDAAGAWTAGLLNLDRMDATDYVGLVGAAGLVVFAGISRWAAATPTTRLVGAQVVAGAGLGTVSLAALVDWEPEIGWYGATVAVLAAAVALAARRIGLVVLSWLAAALAGCGWLVLAVAGATEALAHPAFDRLWLEGEGAELLVASALAAVVVAAPARLLPLSPEARTAVAVLPVAGLAALGWFPFTAVGPTAGVVALAMGAVVLAALWGWHDAAMPQPRAWLGGAAVVGAGGAVLALVVGCVQVALAAVAAADAAVPVWASQADTRIDVTRDSALPLPWTLPLLAVAVALVALLLLAPHPTSPWVPLALVVAVSGAVLPLLRGAPLLVAVLVPAVFGVVLLVGGRLRRLSAASVTGVLLLAGAAVPALGSTGLTAVIASLAVVVAVPGCLPPATVEVRAPAAAVAVLTAACATFSWLSLGPASLEARALAVTGVAGLALVTVQHPRVRRNASQPRVGAEIGAGLAALAGLSIPAAEESYGWLAVALTVTGGVVVLTGLLAPDRRLLTVPGGLLLAAATWVRLADTGVDVVEAYTLPTALVLLAAGCWRLAREPTAVTATTLLPGLLLAIVPSLVVALADPVSLRGLLLGIGSLGLVLVGAWLHWGAPLVVGGVALAALVLRELGPVALAVPRWSLLAVAGALLLAVGITWERRRSELVTAARYVTALR